MNIYGNGNIYRQTNRQTEFMNIFQLCLKVLKIQKYFNLQLTEANRYFKKEMFGISFFRPKKPLLSKSPQLKFMGIEPVNFEFMKSKRLTADEIALSFTNNTLSKL